MLPKSTLPLAASQRTCSLNELKVGEVGYVNMVSPENKHLCSKLLSMGIVAGAKVEIICLAPLGDPIEIKALGYRLSLRRSEAFHVKVVIP